jgi:serine/threonine-protein kinase
MRVLPAGQALRILLQVAQALSAAHAARIVHRDVKPDNVLLTRRGDEEDFVKVIDFGVAHALGGPQGMVCGTPQYMAPEQATGGPHDQRVDVFSFGVLAYETLTGRLPYDVTEPADVLRLTTRPRPRTPQEARPGLFLAAPLTDTLLRCLDPIPEGRPASMEEVVWTLIAAGAAPLETLAEREARRLGLTPPPKAMPPEEAVAPSSATPRAFGLSAPPREAAPRHERERVIELEDVGPPAKIELAVDPRATVRADSRIEAERDIARWRLQRWLVRLAWVTGLGILGHQGWVRGWLGDLGQWVIRLLAS